MKVSPLAFKAARVLLNMEQKDIAAITGIHKQRISSFERGKDRSMRIYETLLKYYEQHIEFLDRDGVRRKPDIDPQTLTGTEGIRTFFDMVYNEALKKGGDFAIFNGVPKQLETWAGADWYRNHAKRMSDIKDNFKFKVIVEENETNFIGKRFAEYRTIPKDKFNNKTIYIYGDHVAFLSFEKNLKIILINNNDIAKSQRILFNSVWDHLTTEIPENVLKL